MLDPLHLREAFVALAAHSFEAVVGFYEALLGRSPQPYVPQIYAEFQMPGLKLGIFRPSDDHVQEFAQSEGAGLSLCLEVEDLEEAIAHLTRMGHPPSGLPKTASHGQEIYAYDPAGNRLILHQSKAAADASTLNS
ncbi:MAG: VOC family protein [Elainellaceae cyanobacterium]